MAIYLFTGQPGSGKTTLAKKLQMWLQTDKANWRKSVFHIDGDQLRELFPNTDYSKEGRYKNINKAFDIAKYLDAAGNDVVISLVSPYKELREKFKSECKVQEVYCHTKKIRGREDKFALDYEPPTEFYVDLDTSESPDDTFKKLLKIII
jgi:adenylylsulfate kinase-like enzyme